MALFPDGHPASYQPHPTVLNLAKQTGTDVSLHYKTYSRNKITKYAHLNCECTPISADTLPSCGPAIQSDSQ